MIITAEERVYDQAVDHFENKGGEANQPAHLINMDIQVSGTSSLLSRPSVKCINFFLTRSQDNHEEATIGAFLFCELVQLLAEAEDLDDEIDELVQNFEAKCNRPILHTVVFY